MEKPISVYEELEPGHREALLTRIQTASPFWSLLGMELVDVKKGWAKVRLPFDRKLSNAAGVAHGGAIFGPADSAIGVALMGMISREEWMFTVEMKINYVKAIRKGEIVAEGRIIHKGARTAIGEVDVRDEKGALVAKGLATYAVVKRR